MLQTEEPRNGIEHPALREQCGKPEKRTAEQVEGIGADQTAAEIRVPVPAELTVSHCIIGKLIERELLRNEISVVDEIPLIHDHEGQQNDQQGQKAQPERQQIFFACFLSQNAGECSLHGINTSRPATFPMVPHIV